MKVAIRMLILLVLLGSSNMLPAQKITGTWEGFMEGEFIQINIEQQGNKLCGYTYDYELLNKASHCVATFEGSYEPDQKLFFIAGRKFIENSGSHVRMRMMLAITTLEGRAILIGQVSTESTGGFSRDRVDMKLNRVSARPQQLAGIMEPCFPKPPRPAVKRPVTKPPVAAPPTVAKPVLTKPTTPVPAPVSKPTPPKKAPVEEKKPLPVAKDSSLPIVKRPQATVTLPDREIVLRMKARKKSEQNRLEVNVKKINLKVYDNGTIDNDTVSIFYNGQLLVSHQRLSETALELNIELKDGVERHEIIMYAENLGGIPPNTALIVVTAGDKRYELRSKANLEENAVLIIEYKPKPF